MIIFFVKAVVIIMAILTEPVIHMVTVMTTMVVLTIQLFLSVLLMIPLVATTPMLGLKHPVSSKINNIVTCVIPTITNMGF